MRYSVVWMLGLCLLVSSCSFREEKLSASDRAREASLRPWFGNLLENLIRPKCLECHNGTSSVGRLDLSTYESILTVVEKGKPEGSRFYTALSGVGGNMPLNRAALSAREIKIVYDWIKNQAPKEEEEVEEPPVEVESSFAWIDTNIIQLKCIGCHDGPEGGGGVDLSSYESFATDPFIIDREVDPKDTLFYKVLATGSMPQGRTKLPKEELEAVLEWIAKGAKKEEDPKEEQ